MSLLTARRLTAGFGGQQVLQGVDLSLEPGEIVTIVGPNGSGKSTLLRVLAGALKPTGGTVTRMPGLRIGYVPQKLHIDRTLPMSVMRFLNLPHRARPDAIARAMARTGVAESLAQRQMVDLSGGQFQRVLLARALLQDPHILMLDEATQGLDQPASAAFYQLIDEIRHEIGCAVLMISHELHVVMSASDRVVCLNGHICCQGTPEVVSSAPEYRALFGRGTQGALALYRHQHDHDHDEGCTHDHGHDHGHDHAHAHDHLHDDPAPRHATLHTTQGRP
ncbi:metal ABC transporter ATP-binding protein [Pseudooceanicola nanhaiensis]|uniref:ATP-binding cassette domain-containing protein n=1 Tax=Pseudooceanicola nanhaiensis TaxID=375761 RepID=UPI001CD4FE32|nr:metal ABC transporter ATP-binding protein [Pseudooceanicola nanhaiensis]MCA0920507.1 metal ABC transporter ATP-binding protein [Pseudooceanicola nanhaiensis]